MSGENSPWYPSMKLFRQSRVGDWSGVFEQMAGELATFSQSARSAKDGH
jgi:hypothetical protein